MDQKVFSERDKQAMRVAWLTAQGWKQEAIQAMLNLKGQSEVSRLLSHARTEKWIRDELDLPKKPKELIGEIQIQSIKKIRNLLAALNQVAGQKSDVKEGKGGLVRSVHVAYSGPPNTTEEQRIEAFGERASIRVLELLARATTCGVAWGRTIKSIVSGIQARHPSPRPELLFLAVSGDPMNHRDAGYSSSAAAEALGKCFGCKKTRLLQGIASRFPKRLQKDEKAIRAFLDFCDDYHRVFGGNNPEIADVSAILSGIGDATSSQKDPWFLETQRAEEMSAEKLNELAIGNLGGVWIERDSKAEGIVAKVNSRWLGIQKGNFLDAAKRATKADEGHPGPIVLGVGQSKAEVVLAALGMISHLIIDHTLCDRLCEKLNVKEEDPKNT